MLTALAVLLRAMGLACRGHRTVALENLALRQQLGALKRHVKRPTLRRRDRLFWIASQDVAELAHRLDRRAA